MRIRIDYFLLIIIAMLFMGTLPGQMRGCETDISNEVNPQEYCQNRCEIECELKESCGIVDGFTECNDLCLKNRNCVQPVICQEEGSFISEDEAKQCIDDWDELTCDIIKNGGSPLSCTREELCDPVE